MVQASVTYLASPPAIGATTPNTGAFTTLSASSTVSGVGFSNYLASPPAIGGTTPAAGTFTTLTANTTLSAPNTFGFKNRIINGAMGIWQRGTTTGSVSGTTGPYMVDRFYGYAGTGNITISQSSNVPSGYTYSCSMVGTGVSITQRIESKNCTDLGGATVTVSFWALNSSGSDNLSVSLYTATGGVDNYSSQTTTANVVSASPSGSWTYYTSTFTSIPSTATNGVGIGISRGSSGASTTLITGVQLEKGPTATSFDYRPYGTELALCQRYFEKSYDQATTPATATTSGMHTFPTSGTTNVLSTAYFSVEKRTSPTITIYDGAGTAGVATWWSSSATQTNNNTQAVPVQTQNTRNIIFRNSNGISGAVAIGYQWIASSEL